MEGKSGVVTDGKLLPDPSRTLRPRTFLTPDLPDQHGAYLPGDRPGRNARQRGREPIRFLYFPSWDGSARPFTDREGSEPSGIIPGHLPRVVPQMVAERGSRELGSLAEHGRDSGSEPEGSEYLTGTGDGSSSEGRSTTRRKSVVVPVQNPRARDGVSGSRDRSTRPVPSVAILSGRNMQTTAAAQMLIRTVGAMKGDTRRRHLDKAGP